MNYRAGIGINVVVLAVLGLVVLALSGFMIQIGSGDISDTTTDRSADAECDTLAERSTTAGKPDEADQWEQQYNENCEGTLDDVVDDVGFFGQDYDRDKHEDEGFFGGGSEGITSGGSEKLVDEGGSKELSETGGSISYIGRDSNTISEKVYLRHDSSGDVNTVTGSAVGDEGCGGRVISGIPLNEVSGSLKECSHSGVVAGGSGQVKIAICEVTSSDQVRISTGNPEDSVEQLC